MADIDFGRIADVSSDSILGYCDSQLFPFINTACKVMVGTCTHFEASRKVAMVNVLGGEVSAKAINKEFTEASLVGHIVRVIRDSATRTVYVDDILA